MITVRTPKYQAIHAVLRERILTGEYAAGSQLPPQQELAEGFGVTLMTLRQAVAALESDGLVWASRGKGTFVVERPVDVRLDHLSSFAAQMREAGVDLTTEVVSVERVDPVDAPAAAAELGTPHELVCIVRLRSVDGVPIALQHSWLDAGTVSIERSADLADGSLYDSIAAATGWTVASVRESITAVLLDEGNANVLAADAGHPAIRSVRTSISADGRPFLYDDALLVGGRCTITADRSSDRLTLRYGTAG